MSYLRKYVNNCGIEKTGDIPHRNRSEKLENHTNNTHTKIKFYIIFIIFFFSTMDIKSFTHWRGQGGWAGGIICSEKWEYHKNSTHTKIKFPITFISIFFLRWIFNFFFYFINAIISTLHISSLYCYLYWYLAYGSFCYILMFFSPPEKLHFWPLKMYLLLPPWHTIF